MGNKRRVGSVALWCAAALSLWQADARAEVRTLRDALAAAYSTNPVLLGARAQLRATDEGVPQALSGWRPVLVGSGTLGYAKDNSTLRGSDGQVLNRSRSERNPDSAQVVLTQPLYTGGATTAGTRAAENRVYAQRARLLAAEQQVFLDTVNAYAGVVQAQQILALNANNEVSLVRQLEITRERFRSGEVTLTDVAQAEASLSAARYARQASESGLAGARATYRRQVGELPDRLVEPQPLVLPVRDEAGATQLAGSNNPAVIAALFDDATARDSIDVALAALYPQLSVQALMARNAESTRPRQASSIGQVVLNASIPIYQGGAEYSRVRQARQTEQQARQAVADARRGAVEQASRLWQALVANRLQIDSTRSQIRANQVALEGVQREAIVGSRTTQDVLNAQGALVTSRIILVQNLASLVTSSYAVAAALGRLTARDIDLGVGLYDETAYYHAVRTRLAGLGDYATGQPHR